VPIELPEAVSGLAQAPEPDDPAPPSSGPSGTIPAQHDYGPSAGCHPWVYFSSLLAITGATGCGDAVGDDHNLLEVTAWVGDSAPVGLGQERGDFIKPVQADPCDLGGSDLETEPVSYAVTVISGPDEDEQYAAPAAAPQPDVDAPMAFLASRPLPGAQVKAGDTIEVEITADDKTSLDSVISGIASVTLTVDGHEVDGLDFTGPVACDKSRLRRIVPLEYVVPENASEVVTVVATVRDYEGHETTVQASYPTVGLWTGYMDVTGGNTITTADNIFQCSTEWEFRVVVFARASGDLYGYAEGVPGTQQCNSPAQGQAQFTRLGVTGKITADHLTLRFDYQRGGWYGILVLYMEPRAELTLTRLGNQAFGEIDVTHTATGDFTDTHDLKGRIDLACDQC
jgi:hypothetical protein